MSRAGRGSGPRRGATPLPRAVAVAAALAAALFVLPLLGLVVRAPWGTALADLATPEAATALRLSLVCSLAATACAIALGLPLAWTLARADVRGRERIARALAAHAL